MATPHSPQSIDSSQSKDLDERDAHLLEHVAQKLVQFGQQVGVTPEEILSPLDSGISMRELLTFLASNASGAA